MNQTFSHVQSKRYMFNELNNLCIYDLKAQKKTMSMKKFRNIPLSRQQIMELRFNKHAEEQQKNFHNFYQTQFRIRISKSKKQKMIQRLANPRKPLMTFSQGISEQQIYSAQNIIKKCSKLKDKILTENKIQKCQKYTQKDYTTLLQQSKWCLAVHCKKG